MTNYLIWSPVTLGRGLPPVNGPEVVEEDAPLSTAELIKELGLA
jgi:hypothetical protein